MESSSHPSQRTRFIFFFIALGTIIVTAWTLFKSPFPNNNVECLIVQGGILLFVLGSFLLEDKFTKPIDATVNGLMTLISILPVFNSNQLYWTLPLVYAFTVFIAGFWSIMLGHPSQLTGKNKRLSEFLYNFVTTLGKARIIYSVIFIAAIFSYYLSSKNHLNIAILLSMWGVYVILWPLKIPHLFESAIESLFSSKAKNTALYCGRVLRSDDPDLLRIELATDREVDNKMLIACLGDKSKCYLKPLFKKIQDSRVILTGIKVGDCREEVKGVTAGDLYITNHTPEQSDLKYTEDELDNMLGIVCEDSTIGCIRFETWRHNDCREGLLVYFKVNGEKVYYQIIDGVTKEEGFESHKQGYQVVEAVQLGSLASEKGFVKYPWLPVMNSPVFIAKNVELEQTLDDNEFSIGQIPNTNVNVIANIDELTQFHTAILGTTGTGKTEFAFSIIEKALKSGSKVICIDITGDYIKRLEHLAPIIHEVDYLLSDKLEKAFKDEEIDKFNKVGAVDTLNAVKREVASVLTSKLNDFLNNPSAKLCVFQLPYISNTLSALYLMGAYLSILFEFARSSRSGSNILIVLEEAHTIIPESSTMGIYNKDAIAMVGRIAQIALQGRKYGIGLLVLAQRTATVSKTVLTQCNTIISFSAFDNTGIDFLGNYFGKDLAQRIPNLQFLEAIVVGKGIKAERPLIIKVPEKSIPKIDWNTEKTTPQQLENVQRLPVAPYGASE